MVKSNSLEFCDVVFTVRLSVGVDGDAADIEQVCPVFMYVRPCLPGRDAGPVSLLLRRVCTTSV